MGWLIFAGGVIVGGAVGFFIACVIMINNTRVANREPKKHQFKGINAPFFTNGLTIGKQSAIIIMLVSEFGRVPNTVIRVFTVSFT